MKTTKCKIVVTARETINRGFTRQLVLQLLIREAEHLGQGAVLLHLNYPCKSFTKGILVTFLDATDDAS